MGKWIERLKRIRAVRYVLALVSRFNNDNGYLVAAGLSFFLILAFVPLLLIGIAGLGFYFNFIHSRSNPIDLVTQLLTTQVLPGAAGDEVKHLMDRANVAGTIHKITDTRGIAGILGLLTLVWTSMQVFLNGAVGVNAAFETKEKRSWIHLRMVAFGLLIVTGVLLVLSITATAMSTAIAHGSLFHEFFPDGKVLITLATEIGAILVSGFMYALIYRYLPAGGSTWKSSAVGAAVASIGWEIAKKGLATYLLHPNVSLYGDLANLLFFLAWVYYSMVILLFGAEASAMYASEVEGAPLNRLRALGRTQPAADPASTSIQTLDKRRRPPTRRNRRSGRVRR